MLRLLMIFMCLCGLIVTNCRNPFAPERDKPASDKGQFTTKDEALNTYKIAYQTQDIELYEQCLDERFIFVFNPFDRAALEELGLRDKSWGKTAEVENTRKIFTAAQTITLNMISSLPTDTSGNGTEYLFRQNLDLTVTLVGQIYSVYGDALFTVKEVSQNNWKIIQIEDLTRG